MLGTCVQSTIQGDPTRRAACVPQLLGQCYRARGPQLLSLHNMTTEALMPRDWTPGQDEPPHHSEEKPPLSSTRASLPAAAKTPHSPRINQSINKS